MNGYEHKLRKLRTFLDNSVDILKDKNYTELDIRFQGIDDDKPTDWYLKLSGAARKMLRGETKMSATIPESL